MKKNNLLLLFIFISFAAFFLIFSIQKRGYAVLTIPNAVFKLKIADSQAERTRGLMNVKKLNENEGMIFVFDNDTASKFWMKNTLIPLDMIWINSQNKVVYIAKNAKPCINKVCKNYGDGTPAKYVVEINGGLSDKYGIGVGDFVKPEFPKNIFEKL